jgi:hypothetical protein
LPALGDLPALEEEEGVEAVLVAPLPALLGLKALLLRPLVGPLQVESL